MAWLQPTTMKMYLSADADIYVETNPDSLDISIFGFTGFFVDIVDARTEWKIWKPRVEWLYSKRWRRSSKTFWVRH